MIFVDGLPWPPPNFDRSSELISQEQGDLVLKSLLEHSSLVSASDRLKAMPERRLSMVSDDPSNTEPLSPSSRHVYVFQREFATVDPEFVELAGTDEATTCVAFIIREQDSGIISIAHLDSPKVINMGLDQMLSSLGRRKLGRLDVHIVGGFDDVLDRDTVGCMDKEPGHSIPLCRKIIEALKNRQEHFHIKTLCVLGHNTKLNANGITVPIIAGVLVDTSVGSIRPAIFDQSSRCPDEIVRRVRVTVASGDSRWKGKLMDTYDTFSDIFVIAPCSWSYNWARIASKLLQLPDSEILSNCSTSPQAENPNFVENERRVFRYLIGNLDWRLTFPNRKPRVHERVPSGGWRICN
ncbi:protein N-terminal asparagine amidohydrolase family protein isoform X2 [Wolffia australiana]